MVYDNKGFKSALSDLKKSMPKSFGFDNVLSDTMKSAVNTEELVKVLQNPPMPDTKPKPPEVSKERLNYEDSLFSDMAEDIKAVQLETNRQLQLLIEENRKSEKFTRKVIVGTLIVAILTLAATICGVIVQLV